MDIVQFKSEKQALQYLSDYTGKRIKIAVEEWHQLPLGDDLMDKIEAIYELEYKYHTLKNNEASWTGNPKRYENTLNKMEDLIKDVASEVADDLIEVFEDWLSKHALTDASAWAKSRVDEEEGIYPEDEVLSGAESEYGRYVGGDFDEDVTKIIGKSIDDSRNLSQFLIEFGQNEKNYRIEEKQEEEGEDYNEDEFEKELEYLDDPEEVWQYMIDGYGSKEAMNVLPDYIKEDLVFSVYKNLVFPAWFEKWKAEGIEATRERVELTNEILHSISGGSMNKIGDITVGINRALNEAHQTGEMLEYIGEKHDIRKSQLDDLSNREVSDWKEELNEMGLKVASNKLNNKEISRQTLGSGKFLELQEIQWKDDTGNIHKWESVERIGGDSAVVAIARTKPSEKLVLIRQYRPPISTYEVGFPAGMIDQGEDPKVAIIRELKEETGYTGVVKNITPLSVNTAGLSSESCYIAEMEIDESLTENMNVKQNLEEDEEIEVFLVDENELPSFVNMTLEKGDQVSGKFMSYLIGKGFDFTQIRKASVSNKELKMKEEEGAMFYDSEEEALQHLADLTGKSIKVPGKNEDIAEDKDEDSMTSSDIGDSLRSQGEEVVKKFDEAASAIDEAIGGVSSAVEGSGSF